jgi:hypothetical protein
MKRNWLTLVVPEDGVDVPSEDETNPPPVLTTHGSDAPTLRLVRVDGGCLPDDAA